MKPVAQSHLEFCREICEKTGENNDDVSDFTSVESSEELDKDEPKVSRSHLNFRSSLRSILSPFFSVFLISQNILVHVQYSHFFLIFFVFICYLLLHLIGSKISTPRFDTSTSISITCNEVAEILSQVKTLTDEIKEIRLSLIAK